jgi:phage gp16-like protein
MKYPYKAVKDEGMPNIRKKLYSLLRVGATNLGWDEEMYRSVLEKHGARRKDGRISASTMSIQQMENVLNKMRASGFVVKPSAGTKPKAADKAIVLWSKLHEKGIIRDGSMQALNAFVKRQTGLDSVYFLVNRKDIHSVLFALEKMECNNNDSQ